ncbi:cell wall hydrolase [Polymorphobacter sp. PAMC 29334]|uniref:cell wall hydrolase n=1 Tax=Polymorphobacter sp. PAMC 29334 TaxID=2862331 RepID=UPI001C66A7ED|nr:cell wall hydrolase [Polymorphobacter sp. PAMC 29334]QYE35730.1 cell wall hydrolase [Polymorphobacter sp. PAMC 29334]
MTFRFPILARLAALAVAVTLLPAAGQFPVAALALAPIVATTIETTQPAADITTADRTTANSTANAPQIAESDAAAEPRPAQLATLVARTMDTQPTAYGDRECLARAVYFEARGEPLEGQLAVAQVILNRVASGKFADSVCGVIAQHGQFSFDKSRTPAASRDWQTAKAIAAIAATAAWDVVAPRAVSFHATRINASWSNLHKVSTIGNHVFYR